ncbi:MAG: DnaJ domain-containing protein, partial [Candidatus Falkowbacteria bacterium]|nr:DnaJ domain-containing protein [Candidatus Falkowbacteria bacterium]
MSKDYYKILGVDKNASEEEIKKAFRAKAHVHHPDKGGDQAKFKELNEAYQVLGSKEKRAQYDQFGSSFGQGQAGGQGFGDFGGFNGGGFNINLDDLGDMFGDFFGGGGGGRSTAESKRGNDIETVVNLEFREAIFGAEKEISINKFNACEHCHGAGSEPGTSVDTCKTCNGRGRVAKIQRTILGAMQVQTTCSTCSGEGKVFVKKCGKCTGKGI